MWNIVEVNNETYFFKCTKDAGVVKYFLCDLKQIWFEQNSIDDVLRRARELNKRIELDDETILSTVTFVPKEAKFEDGAGEENQKLLRIKHYLDSRPFNFFWRLNLAPHNEFKNLITNPLLIAIKSLTEQTDALKEIVKRKDKEIEQYKQEGAVLKRTTVATEPFDPVRFESRYAIPVTRELSMILSRATDLEEQFPDFFLPKEEEVEPNGSSNLGMDRYTKSPRSKKRKLMQSRLNVIKTRLELLEKKVDYDDSDCTPPLDGDMSELQEIQRSWQELETQRLKDLEENRGNNNREA